MNKCGLYKVVPLQGAVSEVLTSKLKNILHKQAKYKVLPSRNQVSVIYHFKAKEILYMKSKKYKKRKKLNNSCSDPLK